MLRVDARIGGSSFFLVVMYEDEMWKPVEGFPKYEVSNYGRVRKGEYVLKPHHTGNSVMVNIGNTNKSIILLVAKAFIPNPMNYKLAYPIDGDYANNKVSNIKWGVRPKIKFEELIEGEIEKDYIYRHYDITRDGKIFRRIDGKELKGAICPKGYMRISLIVPPFSKRRDRYKSYKIHRLVAMFYLDNYSEDLQVNHINGIKTDNRVENLEMVTNSENHLHFWNVLDSTERRQHYREMMLERYRKANMEV